MKDIMTLLTYNISMGVGAALITGGAYLLWGAGVALIVCGVTIVANTFVAMKVAG